MIKALVVYQTTWELLAQGHFRQAYTRLAFQADRALSRRGILVVVNGKVK